MSEFEDTYDVDDALVAEYVLHLLDDRERRDFESRLASDRALQSRVHAWEARLAPMAEDIADVEPPASIKARILQSVETRSTRRGSSKLWAWGVAGLAAASLLAAVLFANLFGPARELTVEFQAELASPDRSIVMVAGVIPETHEIVIERFAGAPPVGSVHELWLIADGADAPVSLGLLENEGVTRIRVPDAIAPGVRTGTIAISEEPPGGSPTGAPTGPVIATAQFSDI